MQIYNGGSMPASNDHFFATHPVELNGAETEGGAGTPVVDTSTTLCVDVLGTQVPAVNDILTAYAVGGRWVAERGSGAPPSNCCLTTCLPCSIPQKNLQVAWTNVISGNGVAPLLYSGGTWISACSNGLVYELLCSGGQALFEAIYFTTGACPTGTRNRAQA